MAQETHDQLRGHPEVAPRLVERIGQSRQDGIERHPPPGVALRIEEYLDMGDILSGGFFQVGERQFEKVFPGEQHRHAGVIEFEEILERAETIRLADGVEVRIGQHDTVALGERDHHFGLQGALDVQVQFGLWHCRDEAMETCLVDGPGPCAVRWPSGYGPAVRIARKERGRLSWTAA